MMNNRFRGLVVSDSSSSEEEEEMQRGFQRGRVREVKRFVEVVGDGEKDGRTPVTENNKKQQPPAPTNQQQIPNHKH